MCRDAADDRIRSHVPADDCSGSNNRAIANRHSRQNGRTVAKPCVVTNLHRIAASPLEKLGFILFTRPVITCTIGEMMQCRTPCRMIGRIDAHMAGNIGKLANLCTPDFAVDTEIGIVIKHSFRNPATRADFRVTAKLAAVNFGSIVNQRFYRELSHAAALGEKAVTSIIRSATCSRTSSSWKMPSIATP